MTRPECQRCDGSGRVWEAMPLSIATFYGAETQKAVAAGEDVKTVFRCDDCNGTGFKQLTNSHRPEGS